MESRNNLEVRAKGQLMVRLILQLMARLYCVYKCHMSKGRWNPNHQRKNNDDLCVYVLPIHRT